MVRAGVVTALPLGEFTGGEAYDINDIGEIVGVLHDGQGNSGRFVYGLPQPVAGGVGAPPDQMVLRTRDGHESTLLAAGLPDTQSLRFDHGGSASFTSADGHQHRIQADEPLHRALGQWRLPVPRESHREHGQGSHAHLPFRAEVR